ADRELRGSGTLLPYTTLFRSEVLHTAGSPADRTSAGYLRQAGCYCEGAAGRAGCDGGGGRSAWWWRIASSTSARRSASFPLKWRSEEHTSELQSTCNLVCRLL